MRLQEAYDRAYGIARAEQRAIVHRILRKYPSITGYCCAMGTAFFYYADGDPVGDEDPRVAEHTAFMDEWGDTFKLTGDPIKIDRNSSGAFVTITDW